MAACSVRSEEHTSELQSQFHLVCRLLLEKKKRANKTSELHSQKNWLLAQPSSFHRVSRISWILIFPGVVTSMAFFVNDPATTEIYTLSLHDALPISARTKAALAAAKANGKKLGNYQRIAEAKRSEEHTSELQSQFHLVCRLLLE